MLAGGPDDGHDVGLDLGRHEDGPGPVPELEDVGRADDRLDGVERLGPVLVATRDSALARSIGIADPDADEEAVELRLRQGEGALELDRVLGRQDDERVGQRPGVALDRDLALLHRLEEGRLGPRRRPVDLVDEEDVREDRPGGEAEGPGFEDARAGDVARQEVGSSLHAIGVERQGLGDGPGQERLADPGDILDEGVALGDQGDRDEPQGHITADDRCADRGPQLLEGPPAAIVGGVPSPDARCGPPRIVSVAGPHASVAGRRDGASAGRGGGRYWTRTTGLMHVKHAL